MKIQKMALTFGIAAATCIAGAQETVQVSGSTTVLPVMQKISESFMKTHPGVTVELSGGGSGNGIKALVDGLTMIAMSSRQIKSGEAKLAQSKSVSPNEIAIAVDAIVPVVNPENPIKNVSVEQLRNIFTGKIGNWKELGGKDAKIVLVSRDTSSGTYETWESLVMKKQRITPRALLQASNGAVVQVIAQNPNAIGYVGIGYLGSAIKALSIDGVSPTTESVLAQKWPLARELYLYTNGTPAGEIKKLVDFSLGTEGQRLVQEAGFIPNEK